MQMRNTSARKVTKTMKRVAPSTIPTAPSAPTAVVPTPVAITDTVACLYWHLYI